MDPASSSTQNDEITHLTIDVIAVSVFGINGRTIQDPKSIFSQMCHRLSDFNLLRTVKIIFSMNFPWLTDLIGMEVMDGARKGVLKGVGADELSSFEKEAQLSEGVKGKNNYLDDDTIAHAQLIAFFFAGFTTTASIVTFAAYALAAHPEVQEKLREEVDKKLFKDGDDKEIDYDELNKLTYLDMFISEVLRKFPPLGRLERKCVKEYHDPESGPEIKAKRNPYCYMPWGMGPRNCIGMRFAKIQVQSAIVRLVHSFNLETTENTPLPMKAKAMGFAIQPPDNLELKLTPRRK
ncbi:Cytochrome P450 9e2 [Orchesella cincta]|uniref:Cytochrome P450 9e2 n=1 Tax=Orchesella cincta TaxID=48709 RepID=A0A1D2MQ28_ORCCI|nr:Cytochrome P450 9e2 [Orchesella cincta]